MAQEPESSGPADRVARSLSATHALLAQIEQVRSFSRLSYFPVPVPASVLRPASGPEGDTPFSRLLDPFTPFTFFNSKSWFYAPDASRMVWS